MSMKMRVLYYTNKGKMISFADIICEKYGCKSDTIPPAYPSENEKLLVLGISGGKDVPNPLRLFCREINKSRARNVAIYLDGPKELAVEITNHLREAGTTVIDDIYYCNGGPPFKFLKRVSEDEKKGITDWITKIYDEVVEQ